MSDAVTVDFKNYYVQQVSYGDVIYNLANGGTSNPNNVINQINTGNCSGDNVFSGNDPFNKCRYIFDSSTLEFWYNNTSCGIWVKNFKMVYIPGYGYYVGFDGEGKTPEEAGANTNQVITNSPDNYYFDRIIKIVPADENGNIIEVIPDNTDSDLCENCEHEKHEGSCPECKEGTVCNPGTKHEQSPIKGEVEINLHGAEKNGQYLESHLSIHVRYATDVEVFIPVPVRYYCEADDLAIVMKHEPNHMIHGGPYRTEYKLKDSNLTVGITVAYETDGIKITTDGITQEVIDWCYEKCHDGITFEIWNYFNDPEKVGEIAGLTLEELNTLLNQSTVKFLTDIPDYYVNAFMEDESGNRNVNDCTVSIIDEQRDNFNQDVIIGRHLNNSDYNEIYSRKN